MVIRVLQFSVCSRCLFDGFITLILPFFNTLNWRQRSNRLRTSLGDPPPNPDTSDPDTFPTHELCEVYLQEIYIFLEKFLNSSNLNVVEEILCCIFFAITDCSDIYYLVLASWFPCFLSTQRIKSKRTE
jgi:hypothetical protein